MRKIDAVWRGRARGVSVLLTGAVLAVLAGGGGSAALAAGPAATGSLKISSFAGGIGGPGLATSVSIGTPCGLTSSGQTLLVGTGAALGNGGGVFRAVSARSDQLTNLAGTYAGGLTPDGTPVTKAAFVQACDLALDHHGNLVLADSASVDPGFRAASGNALVRIVPASNGTFFGRTMLKGRLYTIAGVDKIGNTGDGGPGPQAQIGIPAGVGVDSAGNVVVATAYPTGRIRVIAASTGTFYGQAMTAGDIYTVAGGGATDACATGAADGQVATSVQLGVTTHRTKRNELQEPSGLRIDQSGNILVAEGLCGNRVQLVAAKSGTFYGRAMTRGHIYTIAGGGIANPGNTGLATNAQLGNPSGIALDHAGNLIIAETSTHSVRVVAATTGRFYGRQLTQGHIYTLVGGHGAGSSGDGGPASAARLDFPSAVAVDGQGNIAIADTDNYRVRLIADKNGTFYGKKMRTGDIYSIAGNGLPSFSGDQGPAAKATVGDDGLDLATDHAGDTLIQDAANARVRLVAGQSRTIFGSKRQAGHIYTLLKLSSSSRELPDWVAFDPAGNAVLATFDKIEVIAVRTGSFYGRPMIAGHLYLVAGGGKSTASGAPATQAKLSPFGLAVDSHGNLLTDHLVVAEATGTFFGQHMTGGHVYNLGVNGAVEAVDSHGNAVMILNDKVQIVAAATGTFYGQAVVAGQAFIVAGDGNSESSGDGGPALHAGIGLADVAVDRGGNLLITDDNTSTIRLVAETSGKLYGLAVTAGDIYTIAGGGADVANGAPALSSRLLFLSHLAAGPGNEILVSESFVSVIRRLS